MNARTEPPFHGLWIPLVTPFRHGQIDHDALATLTDKLAANGIAGFVVCGCFFGGFVGGFCLGIGFGQGLARIALGAFARRAQAAAGPGAPV